MQTITRTLEHKQAEKFSQIPAKRERVRRLSDREDAEDIREALTCRSASAFLSQFESEAA